jgi:hypothetical protein
MTRTVQRGDETYVVTTVQYPLKFREAIHEQGINLSEMFREALTNKIENAERDGEDVATAPRRAVVPCHTNDSEDK